MQIAATIHATKRGVAAPAVLAKICTFPVINVPG